MSSVPCSRSFDTLTAGVVFADLCWAGIESSGWRICSLSDEVSVSRILMLSMTPGFGQALNSSEPNWMRMLTPKINLKQCTRAEEQARS